MSKNALAKTVQAANNVKRALLPRYILSYAKIVQTEGNEACFDC